MQNLTFIESLKQQENRIPTLDHLLGKGRLMPFNCENSGSRKIMHSVQLDQRLEIEGAEVPLIQTGDEIRYGQLSSSYITATDNLTVVAKIDKFSHYPGHHYFLIVYNEGKQEYDIIERIQYKYVSETYGYTYNNKTLDNYNIGSHISKDDCIVKSVSFDEYNNRKDGVNLLTTYMASELTKEDGIVISQSAAEKCSSPLIKKVKVVINDNDIPLNLYGGQDLYKIFPDIGEDVKDGILCALRREKKEKSLYLQSYDRLKNFIVSDDKYITKEGKVIDIDIYSNNPDLISNSFYLSQLNYYNSEYRKFLQQIFDVVNPLKEAGHALSSNLQKMLYNAKLILQGGQYVNENLFSNIVIEFTILEMKPLKKGDKISNRYGGKGVISEVIPDHLMPKIIDTDEYVELIFNTSTCINRENAGQLFETSINFVSSRIMEYINHKTFDFGQTVELYEDFLKVLVPEQAKEFSEYIRTLDVDDQVTFLDSVLQDKGIMVSMRPITEATTIDQLADLYEAFKFVKPYEILVPQLSSNGTYRYIKTMRNLICGRQYIYRLKQYAEEKHSAVSLASTNIKNENCRNSADKLYKTTHTKTCVRFGDMETGNLMHLDPEIVVTTLMLYSVSPHGRRQFKDLLTNNPFDIDIKLNEDCSNRSVEIINAYLLAMGLELVFDKVPIKPEYPFARVRLKQPFVAYNGPKDPFRKAPDLKDPFVSITDPVVEVLRNPFVQCKK